MIAILLSALLKISRHGVLPGLTGRSTPLLSLGDLASQHAGRIGSRDVKKNLGARIGGAVTVDIGSVSRLQDVPDVIFRFVASISRRLPPVRGFGRVGLGLMKHVEMRHSGPVAVVNNDATIIADPAAGRFDSIVIFLPQFDNQQELDFVLRNLRCGDVFVDVGANIGKFALPAAARVGPAGKVLAIEPEQTNVDLLRAAVQMNGFTNVDVAVTAIGINSGFSDLVLNQTGNRGMHSIVQSAAGGPSIRVPVKNLRNLLQAPPRVLKMDIEGLDEAVFLDLCQTPDLLPPFVLLEQSEAGCGTAFVAAVAEVGYRVVGSSHRNLMLELESKT